MNNPFKQVYEAAIERGESAYDAIICAKTIYADYVFYLNDARYESEFIIERLNEYSSLLAEALNR
jgi:competence transcription factor ComK